jgi:hypothetical protein
MPDLTIADVQRAILETGGKEQLRRGHGYYYFVMEDGAISSPIYMGDVRQLSLSHWLYELTVRRPKT